MRPKLINLIACYLLWFHYRGGGGGGGPAHIVLHSNVFVFPKRGLRARWPNTCARGSQSSPHVRVFP